MSQEIICVKRRKCLMEIRHIGIKFISLAFACIFLYIRMEYEYKMKKPRLNQMKTNKKKNTIN